MNIAQFTFTGSPWGFSAPGWTVFQFSNGFDPKRADAYRPYYCFTGAQGFSPVRLVFAKDIGTGTRILSQSLDAGPRWYDPIRGHDYFAHVFVAHAHDGSDVAYKFPVDFNPVAWIRSPEFQTEFPESCKEKALQIFKGEKPNEPPPHLPTLNSWGEISANPDYDDNVLLGRIPDGALAKLGRICMALSDGINGKKRPVTFDMQMPMSLDIMALVVRLLPISKRMDISFSTWLAPNEISSFFNVVTPDFIGTHNSGVVADADTGVYDLASLPDKGPKFTSYEDVVLFRDMLDICDEGLNATEYETLVQCWKMCSGQDSLIIGLKAVKENVLCMRFPKLRDMMLKACSSRLSVECDNLNNDWKECLAVAKYELDEYELDVCGLDDFIDRLCEKCLDDAKTFARLLNCLACNDSRMKFIGDVVTFAQREEQESRLVRMLIDSGIQLDGYSKNEFVGMVTCYSNVKRQIDESKTINCIMIDSLKDAIYRVKKLQNEIGDGEVDVQEVLNVLEYKSALCQIHAISDIAICLKNYKTQAFPVEARPAADILEQIDMFTPDNIGKALPENIVALLDAFNAIGIDSAQSNEHILQILRDWRTCILQKYKGRIQTLEKESEKLKKLGIKVLVGATLFSVVVGWLLHVCSSCVTTRKNSPVEMMLVVANDTPKRVMNPIMTNSIPTRMAGLEETNGNPVKAGQALTNNDCTAKIANHPMVAHRMKEIMAITEHSADKKLTGKATICDNGMGGHNEMSGNSDLKTSSPITKAVTKVGNVLHIGMKSNNTERSHVDLATGSDLTGTNNTGKTVPIMVRELRIVPVVPSNKTSTVSGPAIRRKDESPFKPRR